MINRRREEIEGGRGFALEAPCDQSLSVEDAIGRGVGRLILRYLWRMSRRGKLSSNPERHYGPSLFLFPFARSSDPVWGGSLRALLGLGYPAQKEIAGP